MENLVGLHDLLIRTALSESDSEDAFDELEKLINPCVKGILASKNLPPDLIDPVYYTILRKIFKGSPGYMRRNQGLNRGSDAGAWRWISIILDHSIIDEYRKDKHWYEHFVVESDIQGSAADADRDGEDTSPLDAYPEPGLSPEQALILEEEFEDLKKALKPRELEVWGLYKLDFKNKEIAEMLDISPSAVSQHIANIRLKANTRGLAPS